MKLHEMKKDQIVWSYLAYDPIRFRNVVPRLVKYRITQASKHGWEAVAFDPDGRECRVICNGKPDDFYGHAVMPLMDPPLWPTAREAVMHFLNGVNREIDVLAEEIWTRQHQRAIAEKLLAEEDGKIP